MVLLCMHELPFDCIQWCIWIFNIIEIEKFRPLKISYPEEQVKKPVVDEHIAVSVLVVVVMTIEVLVAVPIQFK